MMGGDPLLSGFEDPEEFGFETRAIRAGQPHDARTGGVVTPIAMATTFAQDAQALRKTATNILEPETRPGTPMKLASHHLRAHNSGLLSRAGCLRRMLFFVSFPTDPRFFWATTLMVERFG